MSVPYRRGTFFTFLLFFIRINEIRILAHISLLGSGYNLDLLLDLDWTLFQCDHFSAINNRNTAQIRRITKSFVHENFNTASYEQVINVPPQCFGELEPFHFDPAPASHDGGSGSSSVPVKHNLLL